MKKKPALSAVGYMESDFVRYVIQNEKGGFWTGRGFTMDQRRALAYADENVIARDMRRILKCRCKRLIRYRFIAPVLINVYAEGQIDQEEIEDRSRVNEAVGLKVGKVGVDEDQ
jgi:hypothetical protein